MGVVLRVDPKQLAVGVLLLSAGCSSPVCGCSPVDTSASAYVSGRVTDASLVPVAAAEIRAVGTVRPECTRDGSPVLVHDPVISDDEGRFDLTIETWDVGPGAHCVELMVSDPEGRTATFPDRQLEFRNGSSPRVTTELVLTVPW